MRKEKKMRSSELRNRGSKSLSPRAPIATMTARLKLNQRNIIIRDVRDRTGIRLTTITARHDGTAAGIVGAARCLTDRMYTDFPEASNIESRILATDDAGKPKWIISPNFNHLAELGTDDAAYIWGDLTARTI